MKKLFVISAALCAIIPGSQRISAQLPLIDGCSSAGVIGQPVLFNCDFSETSSEILLHHRGQSESAFTDLPMNLLNEPPYYESTLETSVTFPSNPIILEYYFSARQDTLLATQSPENSNNQFPPLLYKYADFVPDPQGDMAPGSAGNWLDITGNGMTYSDTRLYCYLQNRTGTWPLNQLITYFAYTFGFMITSGPDSSFYALVYANVPLLLSTGLYRLDLADSSYTRLGDINTSTSGGLLHLACDISTLGSDPGWPGWPPPEGYIIPLGATLTAGLSGQFVNDFTYPAAYQPVTHYLDFAANLSPELSACGIEPDSGIGIMAHAVYRDGDNNLPVTRIIHFDSDSYAMASFDHIYSDSSEFESNLPWPGGGWHHYYFEFSDGAATVESPLDSILVHSQGCQYIPGDINNNGAVNGIDVVYGVVFFKGGPPPPVDCGGICPQPSPFFAAGDVNGGCTFNGIDIGYFVNYLKGGQALQSCPTCLPPN